MTIKPSISLLILLLGLSILGHTQDTRSKPNVLIIITDDQGYGDMGYYGNTIIKTPHLDALAQESVRFNHFLVSPVCAPTRSSLMTGRYSLRTGIRDTYNGGAIMATEEITLAELLKESGYTTGVFGKWHLGDTYPSRPNDQGFDESIIHLSGGMGQVGDFTTYFQRDRSYYDPILWHNGTQQSYKGYCSDIFAQGAVEFMEKNADKPFFCYLSFNAPHTPLQVPEKYERMYADVDMSEIHHPHATSDRHMSKKDIEDAQKIYAMMSNVDENIGKVLGKLDEMNIRQNTVVIFMSDNGPQQLRYNHDLRGLKGSVYRGGINVPFFLRYPDRFEGDREIDQPAAHIDIYPTLAELCQAEIPGDRKIDGMSLLSLLRGDTQGWSDRSLFFYWTRKYPQRYRNMAIQRGSYKMVGQLDYDASWEDFELFNLDDDPLEENNIVSSNPQVAMDLKSRMDQFVDELLLSPHILDPPRIQIGSSQENPVVLNRNDAGGQRGIWAQEEIFGTWNVDIAKGIYNLKIKFVKPVKSGGIMTVEIGHIVHQKHMEGNSDLIEMKGIQLPDISGELIPFYSVDGKRIFPFWIEVEKVKMP